MGAEVAELHPYGWRLAWTAARRLPFLLPHDKSYNAFRHFVALRPGGLFVDIGANDGISALSFRRFDRSYRILSLEPNRLLEPWLQEVKDSDPHLEYMMVGAGSVPARIQFYVPIYRGVVLHTFASASLESTRATLANSYGEAIAAACRIDTVDAEIVRLDDLNLEPTIVKIDAEGFDHDVLVGAVRTVERCRPFVVVEIDDAQTSAIRSYFEARHYQLLGYDIAHDRFNPETCAQRSGRSGERNLFAIPEEMLSRLAARTQSLPDATRSIVGLAAPHDQRSRPISMN
jgi:FkbM family methyltransferase